MQSHFNLKKKTHKMAGAESNVNSGRKKVGNSLMKQRRQAKQQSKAKRGVSARDVVAATNEEIPNVLDTVIAATQKKRQQLLLSDKPYAESELNKVKWTRGIRPAKVGVKVDLLCLSLP